MSRAGIGAGVDQQPDGLRAVGEVAGPVGDMMQRRPAAAAPGYEVGRRQPWIAAQQSPDRPEVTGVNRRTQLGRGLVVLVDPPAGLLLTHDGSSCQPPRTVSGPAAGSGICRDKFLDTG